MIAYKKSNPKIGSIQLTEETANMLPTEFNLAGIPPSRLNQRPKSLHPFWSAKYVPCARQGASDLHATQR
jgi:hypothetical protein